MSENDYNAYWERMEQEWEQDAVGSKRTMKKSISNHVERLRVKRQHEKNRETEDPWKKKKEAGWDSRPTPPTRKKFSKKSTSSIYGPQKRKKTNKGGATAYSMYGMESRTKSRIDNKLSGPSLELLSSSKGNLSSRSLGNRSSRRREDKSGGGRMFVPSSSGIRRGEERSREDRQRTKSGSEEEGSKVSTKQGAAVDVPAHDDDLMIRMGEQILKDKKAALEGRKKDEKKGRTTSKSLVQDGRPDNGRDRQRGDSRDRDRESDRERHRNRNNNRERERNRDQSRIKGNSRDRNRNRARDLDRDAERRSGKREEGRGHSNHRWDQQESRERRRNTVTIPVEVLDDLERGMDALRRRVLELEEENAQLKKDLYKARHRHNNGHLKQDYEADQQDASGTRVFSPIASPRGLQDPFWAQSIDMGENASPLGAVLSRPQGFAVKVTRQPKQPNTPERHPRVVATPFSPPRSPLASPSRPARSPTASSAAAAAGRQFLPEKSSDSELNFDLPDDLRADDDEHDGFDNAGVDEAAAELESHYI